MSGLFGSSTGGGQFQSPTPWVRGEAFSDPYSPEMRNRIESQIAGVQGRAPLRPEEFRDRQSSLADSLLSRATGESPGLSREVLEQQTQRNLGGVIGQTLANRSMSPGLAARTGMRGFTDIQRDATAQGVLSDIQERIAAEQSLGTLLSQARGQDISAQSASDNLLAGLTQQLMGLGQTDRDARMNLERLLSQNQLTAAGQSAASFGDYQARRGAGVSGAIGTGMDVASMAMMIPMLFGSDERMKKDVNLVY